MTTTLALAYGVMSEKELDKHVHKLCDDLGLICYHTLDSRGSSCAGIIMGAAPYLARAGV